MITLEELRDELVAFAEANPITVDDISDYLLGRQQINPADKFRRYWGGLVIAFTVIDTGKKPPLRMLSVSRHETLKCAEDIRDVFFKGKKRVFMMKPGPIPVTKFYTLD